LTELGDIYEHIFRDPLILPSSSFEIGEATLTLSKNDGFRVEIHDMKYGDYTAIDGIAEFGSQGISLQASVEGGDISVGGYKIQNAFLKVFLGRHNEGGNTSLIFTGDFEWKSLTFDTAIHLYESSDGDHLEYTLYGHFKDLVDGQGLPIVSLIPELAKSNLLSKLTLEDAALIVASQDDPDFGALLHSNYSVKKGKFLYLIGLHGLSLIPLPTGFQISAVLGGFQPLKDIVRGTQPDLIFRAGWSEDSRFDLFIFVPSSITLNLGRGVTTDPIELTIDHSALSPGLVLIAGAHIPTYPSNSSSNRKVSLLVPECFLEAGRILLGSVQKLSWIQLRFRSLLY
jgi:hypothetical protein